MFEVSSDSEDYYDNFPQKLKKLKTKYALNNRLNVEKNEVNENDFETNGLCLVSGQETDFIPVVDLVKERYSPDLIPVEVETCTNEVSTRSLRNKRKECDIQLSPLTLMQKGGKRGRTRRGRGSESTAPSAPKSRGKTRKGRGSQSSTNSDFITADISTPSTQCGRGRGRRRGSHQTQSIITYSVGNTDEYFDASDGQSLFSDKNVPTAPNTVLDLDESLDNEELSVKVYWQHSQVFKFNIRRFQKLAQIFDFFVNKEGVSEDRLLFTYNHKKCNKILKPDDTPESIDYNIAYFIDGGIVNNQVSLKSCDTPQKEAFTIKFQCENKKKPIKISVRKEDTLKLAMIKCAEHLEIPMANLIFEFDGETINGSATPKDLDMDNGDCIDVKTINVNK